MVKELGRIGAVLAAGLLAAGCMARQLPSGAAGPIARFQSMGTVGNGQSVMALAGMSVDPSTVWTESEGGFRHIQSGVTCAQDFDWVGLSLHSLVIYEANGSKAACRYKDPNRPVNVTFYLIEAPGKTAQTHVSSTVYKVQQRYPKAGSAFVDAPDLKNNEGQPIEAAMSALNTNDNGIPQRTSILVVRRDPWHINAQGVYPDDATAPMIDARMTERARQMLLQAGG